MRRLFCYFPSPTLDSCLKNKPWLAIWPQSPREYGLPLDTRQYVRKYSFCCKLQYWNSASQIHPWVSRLELSILMDAGLQQSSLKNQLWPSVLEVLVVWALQHSSPIYHFPLSCYSFNFKITVEFPNCSLIPIKIKTKDIYREQLNEHIMYE